MTQKFELWLETEIGDPSKPAHRDTENFCSIEVTLTNGRRDAMNVWIFDFLPLARYPWPDRAISGRELEKYLPAPDLFIETLDRATIEAIISKMFAKNELRSVWLWE